MDPRLRVALALALVLLLAGCGPGTPQPQPLATLPPVATGLFTGPGYLEGMPAAPSPSATPPGPDGTPATQALPVWPPDPLPVTYSVSSASGGGWTAYDSLNQIQDVAFAPDGSLWAATGGGLVRWDVATGTYTRYGIRVRRLDAAPDGTLWLAGSQGVCRLDSAACTVPPGMDSFPGDYVAALAAAPDGTVWLATGGNEGQGISHWDGEAWHAYPSNVTAEDLAVGVGGEVWAATPGGVGRYDPARDGWATYTQEQGLPAEHATSLAAGPGGEVWVDILWEGIYHFDGRSWQPVTEVGGGFVGDLAIDAGGTAWAGTVGSTHYPGGRLAYYAGEAWVDVSSEAGLHSFQAIAAGPDGQMAAATNLGLGVYQAGAWRLLADGPTHDQVQVVALTPDGSAWLGFGDNSASTPGWGLSRFDGRAWSHYLDDAEVTALAAAPDGSLWAAVGCQIQRFDGQVWAIVSECDRDLPPGNIHSIAFAPDGTPWVANAFALARLDGQKWIVYDKLIHYVVAAPDGSIWANGWTGQEESAYVGHLDGDLWTLYPAKDAYPGPFTMQAVTADGRVWGTTQDGRLAAFDGGSWTGAGAWTTYTVAGDLPLDGIRAVDAAPDGALWVATGAGVARYDGEWVVYPVDEALGSRITGNMAFAPDGSVWFGAVRLQPDPPD